MLEKTNKQTKKQRKQCVHFHVRQSFIHMKWEVGQTIFKSLCQQCEFSKDKICHFDLQCAKSRKIHPVNPSEQQHTFYWNVSIENMLSQRQKATAESGVQKWSHPLGGFHTTALRRYSGSCEISSRDPLWDTSLSAYVFLGIAGVEVSLQSLLMSLLRLCDAWRFCTGPISKIVVPISDMNTKTNIVTL